MPPPQCTRPEQAPLSLPSTPHTHLVVGGPPARARRWHYEPSRVRFRPQSTLGRVRIRTLYENEKPPMTQDTGQVQTKECRREASLCSSSRPRRLRCERVPCSDAPDSIPPLPEGDHTRLDACGTGIHLLARARKRLPRPPRPLFSLLPGQIARILTGIWLTRWIIAGSRLLCRLTAIWVGRPSSAFHVSRSPSLPFSLPFPPRL